MKIAIVGPTHPYKGGIAQHTTQLAHRLAKAGHTVELISWQSQYPFFYPGVQFVPADKPELPPFPNTKRVLSWKSPASWWRWGRRLRTFDQVIFIWWVPTIQGPVYLSMLRALGKRGPATTLICHNVLPHEPRTGDARLARAVLRRVNRVVVHTVAQAALVEQLSMSPPAVLQLPMSLPMATKLKHHKLQRQLLFFGFIRPYKGVDVLLRALATVPDIHLTVAGEFWGGPASLEALADELHIRDRVTFINRYLPNEELATKISEADAVVLPYIEGTASWNATLAHACGTPVIATTAGSLATQVQSDIDGLLCEPGSVSSLAQAIQHFYEPGIAQQLRRGIPVISAEPDWQQYTANIATI